MRTIKQISLALILIVGLIFIFNGCQKEYISSTPKSDIVLKRITYEDINLNSKLKKSIINIRSKEKESMQNRMVYDSLNGFFFDDSNGKLTEIDGKKSYTFTVYRRNGDDKIENIIFNEKENGEYEALFAKYDYSKEEMLSLTQEELETKDPIITDLNSNRQQLCVEYKEYICVPPFNGDLVGQYAEMDCSWVTVWGICSGSGGEVGVPHNYDATQYGSPSEPYDNNNTNPGGLSTSAVLPTQAGEFVNSLGFATVDEFLSLPDAVKTIIFTYLYNNNYSNQVVTPTKYALQHFNYLWFSELSESLQVAIMNYLTQNNFSSESKNNINEIQHFLAQNQNSQEALSFAYQAVESLINETITDSQLTYLIDYFNIFKETITTEELETIFAILNSNLSENEKINQLYEYYENTTPIIDSLNQSDYETAILNMTNYMKQFGYPNYVPIANYIESLIPEFPNFTMGDVVDVYHLTRNLYNDLRIQYFFAAIIPFAEAAIPFLEFAIIDATLGAALPIIAKIPSLFVSRGAELEAMILEITKLGVEGTSPTIRIIEGSNALKAEELFTTLTRDALSKTTQTNGAIVADMGNGNYITFRPLSASTSGFPASINFNYQELLGTNNFVIKFP